MAQKRIADHTLQVLEFPSVLELVATYASNELGRVAVRSLTPSTDVAWIQTQLAQTAEVLDLLDQDKPLPLAGIRDIRIHPADGRGSIPVRTAPTPEHSGHAQCLHAPARIPIGPRSHALLTHATVDSRPGGLHSHRGGD